MSGPDTVLTEDIHNGDGGHAAKHNAVNDQVNWLTETVVSFGSPVVAVGAGVDPTGATSSSDALQAFVDGAPPGASVELDPGIYKLTRALRGPDDDQPCGLFIGKPLRFGGRSATRWNSDLSNPSAGVQFIYDGVDGDAILVQAPPADENNDNGRISPVLHDIYIRGNKNAVGATGGGGLMIDGDTNALAGGAVSLFVLENVHVSEAKGNGITAKGDAVYEGRMVGVTGFRCGGKGIDSTAGETLLMDGHFNDNAGDGAHLHGPSVHTVIRCSSSRNGGRSLLAEQSKFNVFDWQAESNAGDEVITLDDVAGFYGAGVNIDYTEPDYEGTGIAIKGTSREVVIENPDFSGSSPDVMDIVSELGTGTVTVRDPRLSGGDDVEDRVELVVDGQTVSHGGWIVYGTMQVSSGRTDAAGLRIRLMPGQTEDAFQILNGAGAVIARINAGGSIRSLDDIVARLGAGNQASLGEVGPGGQGGVAFGGGLLYAVAGALVWKGPGGTTTTIAPT